MPDYLEVKTDGKIRVHDIHDIDAFVRVMIFKTKLKLTNVDEREDLISEGIAILLDLAKKYKPQMIGYDRPGSFAGYCSIYLPKKIATAWHRWHPEYILETRKLPDGRVVKRYVYGDTAASWDEQVERDGSVDSERLRSVGDFVRPEPGPVEPVPD